MRSTTSFCSITVQVADGGAMLQEVEQQRRGDVVGQVARQPQLAAAVGRQLREIEIQRIAFMQA